MLLLLLPSAQLMAQLVKITGTVVDRENGEPLIAATVRAMTSGGGEETFGITNEKGVFSMDVPRMGSYQVEFSYVGFEKVIREFSLRPGPNNLGRIRMSSRSVELDNAQVIGKNMRVKQTQDTTVYNADGYKVLEGATGEDLIAKMPGMRVVDGKVEAQGEEVKRVMVDGKPFFENDPSLALRTLPAEVIQSIAVFDRKSDQAEFTGFDDGNTVKAIDVRTRSYKRNGVFGKLYGQYGLDNRYNFGGNVNLFNGDRRVTLMGLFNNVNQQNFSVDDILGAMSGGNRSGRGGAPMGGPGAGGMRSSSMVGTQDGVTSANAVGVNYSDTWGSKVEVQGSYFFNMTRNELKDSLNRNYFDTLGGARIYDQVANSLSHNYSHRFNMRLTYKPNERNEFIFIPTMSLQKNDSESITTGMTYVGGDLENRSETTQNMDANGYNLSGELLWRHKFVKDGRTVSASLRGGASNNDSRSEELITLNQRITNQNVNSLSTGYNYSANMVYTEPIGKDQQLSASYNFSLVNSDRDKVTEELIGEQYIPDDYLSSSTTSDYITQSVGAGYRLNKKLIRFMANLNFQHAELRGTQAFPFGTMESFQTSKSFNSVLPMAMLDYQPKQNISFRLMYRSSSSAPAISQLQQTIDNSNPLQLYQGNPDLNQVIDHSLSLRYISSNVEKATNWMGYVSVSKKADYIGADVTVALEDMVIDENITLAKGGQISKPVNMDGHFGLNSNLTYGFPIDFLMSNLNISAGLNYNETPGIYNGVTSKTKSLSMVPGAVLTSNISQNIDFTLSYNADFNKVNNNLQSDRNYNYLTHTANAKAGWVIWKGIMLESNLNWRCFTGSSMEEAENIWVWNMSVGKRFLKNNRAELKLSGFDLLEQNKAFRRTIADNYIQTSYSNVLGRYFMLSFTYNLQNFKKPKAQMN